MHIPIMISITIMLVKKTIVKYLFFIVATSVMIKPKVKQSESLLVVGQCR